MPQAVDSESHEELSIRYAGPGLEANSMDVRQLAPSLLALADVVVIAHRFTGSPAAVPPALEVTAQRSGSFIVDLWIAAQDQGVDLFSGDGATAISNAKAVGELVLGGMLWAVLRGRKGREASQEEVGSGQIRVNWADGTVLEAPIEAAGMIENMDFHRAAGRVLEPLRDRAVDEIELKRPRTEVRFQREDLRAFNVPGEDDDLLSDNRRTVAIKVDSLAFKAGNKWRVHDGANSIWASLADLQFAQRMAAGEEFFANGDMFIVEMRDIQYRTSDGGIRAEHIIERVLEHRSNPPQDPLPFPE